jgi:hypothetical protein
LNLHIPNCTWKLWKCLRKIFYSKNFKGNIVYEDELSFHPELWASVNIHKIVEEEKLGSDVQKWVEFFDINGLVWHPIILQNKIITFEMYLRLPKEKRPTNIRLFQPFAVKNPNITWQEIIGNLSDFMDVSAFEENYDTSGDLIFDRNTAIIDFKKMKEDIERDLAFYYCENPNVTWEFVWNNYRRLRGYKNLFRILSKTLSS